MLRDSVSGTQHREGIEQILSGDSNEYFQSDEWKSNQSTESKEHHDKNIYIRGLSPTCTDEELFILVSRFGTVISSKAILNEVTGQCKGYGFAMYKKQEVARAAIKELNELGYQAAFAKDTFKARLKDYQDSNTTNIYISNIPEYMSESDLIKLFHPYQAVSTRILRDDNGKSRRVGFARMENREVAQKTIDKFNAKLIPGSKTPLKLRFADSVTQKKMKRVEYSRASVSTSPPVYWGPMLIYHSPPSTLPPIQFPDTTQESNNEQAFVSNMGIMPRSPHAVRFGSPVYSSPKYVTQSGYSSPTGMVAHPGYISPPLYRSAQSPILSPMFASPIPVYNGQHVAHAPGSPYNGGYAVIGYGSPTNMSATDLGTSGYASPDYISPHLLSSPVYDMHPGYRPRFEQMPSGNTASDGHIQPLPIDRSSNPSHT